MAFHRVVEVATIAHQSAHCTMNKIRQLHLVPIGLSEKLRVVSALGQKLPAATSHCLSRARVQLYEKSASSLALWQINTLRALPQELNVTGKAAAALTWLGEGGAAREGTWMNISLAHFSAGLNDVHIVPVNDIAEEQAQQLMSTLQPLLLLSGFELHHSTSGHWYLWCASVLEVNIPAIEQGFSTRNYDVLPTGRDAAPLRRLMTEIQMVLHQHSVNKQREAQGLPALNAVWLSGAGALIPATSSTLQRILSEEPYVMGLCKHINANCFPVPPNVGELLQSRDDDVVLVMQAQDAQQFDSEWLLPLMHATNVGRLESFHLYLDHARLTLEGGRWQQLRRWISSANPVEKLLPEILN